MEKIVILMSTYNGEKFILDQLDSLFTQDYPGEIIIYIRDDGSTDLTTKLIKSYQQNANRKIILQESSNIGPQKSFLSLIREAPDGDYYFFADQDGVWCNNKISFSVDKLKRSNAKYKMFCSNYSIVDKDLMSRKNNAVEINNRTFHFLRAVLYNSFPGCVIGINDQLLNVIQRMDLRSCMMHDSLTFATAVAIGEIIYCENPLILHRIHGENVVGDRPKKIIIHKWIKEKISLLINKEDYDISEFAYKLNAVCGDEIIEIWKKDVDLLMNFKIHYINTMKLFFHPDVRNVLNRCSLSIWCKILFHIF